MLGPLIQWGFTSGSKVNRSLVCLWLHNDVLKTMAFNSTFDTTVCQLEEHKINSVISMIPVLLIQFCKNVIFSLTDSDEVLRVVFATVTFAMDRLIKHSNGDPLETSQWYAQESGREWKRVEEMDLMESPYYRKRDETCDYVVVS